MSKRFNNSAYLSPRQSLEQQYRTSRANLLAVVIFTAVNLLLLITNSNLYFLFSAFIPQFIASIGMFITGKFPDEYYTEEMVFLDSSVFVILLIIAIAITLLYLLAWYMSKNRRKGWLIFALVLFGVDTISMFNGFGLESILDLLFHAWVIYYLVVGIRAAKKLEDMPEEDPAPFGTDTAVVHENAAPTDEGEGEDTNKVPDSPIIRMADNSVKHRILLDSTVLGYDIIYRRVNRTNELVINGRVYAEYTALMEQSHTLSATLDGHYIQVGLRKTRSFILFDGTLVVEKVRWV